MKPFRHFPVAVAAAVLVAGGFWWTSAAPPESAPVGDSADRIVIQRESGAVLIYGYDPAAEQRDVDAALIDRAIENFWPCRPGTPSDLRSERRRGLNFNQPLNNGVVLLPICTGGPALAR